MDNPIARLRSLVPHLKIASEMARLEFPDGKIDLAVVGSSADKGRVVCRFEFDTFMKDLEALLDAQPQQGGGLQCPT